jgi:hypothetical protein
MMASHDFLVKGFDHFGNGRYSAVLVKQGMGCWLFCQKPSLGCRGNPGNRI